LVHLRRGCAHRLRACVAHDLTAGRARHTACAPDAAGITPAQRRAAIEPRCATGNRRWFQSLIGSASVDAQPAGACHRAHRRHDDALQLLKSLSGDTVDHCSLWLNGVKIQLPATSNDGIDETRMHRDSDRRAWCQPSIYLDRSDECQ
jgi:hypothetical protein